MNKILESVVFIVKFGEMVETAHQIAKEKGWWDEPAEDGTLIALIHSELSEALEAIRHGNPPDDKIPEFSGLEAELADVIIRIMDLAGYYQLRIGEAIVAKMLYNNNRSYKHGGKKF